MFYLISALVNTDLPLTVYKMGFIDLTIITPYEFNVAFYVDVVGQAIFIGELQTLQCSRKERKKIKFTLGGIK
ncbi:hypothetical protein IGI04_036442 [Brassica rapa subsp. trilocularis]|uniref:Xylanase inhibitor C-terminal domain-containing protein n=1 Tax=Brassica rapa subsp. trilocularis TaxID=1813537 RepID=A0ABQ7LFG4_BRACM|nr:hypothetical protein IGI04_036442 [Brassica rapa subsp. trilocularis]